ncbi:hypothetical protein BDD12DRAFT_881517 [Trichophaea hybrida]|nr:hypothetical protein BDD12DRAFT_881517 [Trichophaea hybrida]
MYRFYGDVTWGVMLKNQGDNADKAARPLISHDQYITTSYPTMDQLEDQMEFEEDNALLAEGLQRLKLAEAQNERLKSYSAAYRAPTHIS